ncbi:hypothetical protein DFJ63DRAFT_310993 [Scheffersomyces coipomensis]|uniref:uncharacterized protein n=1 Tax=Scheffersomyces coipomensis TaxID=1788519 RepID=UPI00315DD140
MKTEQFLRNYFLLLPNDILIEIFKLLPPRHIQFFMNIKLFEPPIYDVFISRINISTTQIGIPRSMTFTVKDTELSLESLPYNYIPKSIRIQINSQQMAECMVLDSQFIKLVKDIRISLIVDLNNPPSIETSKEIIQLQNLTKLTIQFNLQDSKENISSSVNITNSDDLLMLQELPQLLSEPQNFKNVYKNLPISVHWLQVSTPIEILEYDQFTNLKSLCISLQTFENPVILPNSLEEVFFLKCEFEYEESFPEWSENLKSICIKDCSHDCFHDPRHINLGVWPLKLKEIYLQNNDVRGSIVCELPPFLEYLEITDQAEDYLSLISHTIDKHIIFPESLAIIRISSIYLSHVEIIEFPPNLKRLTIANSLKSLNQCIFPTSLEYLNFNLNTIESLTEYNNLERGTHWHKLINLKTLKLNSNSLCHEGVVYWIPPPNLEYFDASGNDITSMDIALFKFSSKEFTNNLKYINLRSYTTSPIDSLPEDLYIPDNVEFIDILGFYRTENALQKKVNAIIDSQIEPTGKSRRKRSYWHTL